MDEEQDWHGYVRAAAKSRPRTTLSPRIKWTALQQLIREFDYLWQHASDATKASILAMREAEARLH